MSSKTRTASKVTKREEQLDRVFGALSNRTRRSMLARLGRAPATISELADPLDMSFPAVSKHLRVLEHAGLIKRAVDGRVHRCSLESAPLTQAEQWLSHYRGFWNETLDALTEHARRKPR